MGRLFQDPSLTCSLHLTSGVIRNFRFELKLQLFCRRSIESNFHLHYHFSSIQLLLTRRHRPTRL